MSGLTPTLRGNATNPADLPGIVRRLVAGFLAGFVPVALGMTALLAVRIDERLAGTPFWVLAWLVPFGLLVSPAMAGAAWRAPGVLGCVAGIGLAVFPPDPLARVLLGGLAQGAVPEVDSYTWVMVMPLFFAPISLVIGLVAWGFRAAVDRRRHRR